MHTNDSIKHTFTVYTYDIDYAGHVSNITYIRWLETLRYLLLQQYLPLSNIIKKGYFPVVARTDIRYIKPIYLFEHPLGILWVAHVGAVRTEVRAKISVQGELRASAMHHIAFVSKHTLKLVPNTRIEHDLNLL